MIARKEPPGAEGPSHPRADYYRRERRDSFTPAYTGGDLPTQPNSFPMFAPQKSIATGILKLSKEVKELLSSLLP
jgi:hypothetical protein